MIPLDELLLKVKKLRESNTVDLSMEEDLSIAIMNLISLEEHFFFTSQKTQKPEYLDLLAETREIRKSLMERMIDHHEGETWCITKHLLAVTMRLIEVGTKLQTVGEPEKSKDTFEKAYKVYSLFWAIRLKLIKLSDLKDINESEKPMSYENIISGLVDCCKE